MEEGEELDMLHHGTEIHFSTWRSQVGAENKHEEKGATKMNCSCTDHGALEPHIPSAPLVEAEKCKVKD